MISPSTSKNQTYRTVNTCHSITTERSLKTEINQLQEELEALRSMMTFLLEYEEKCISDVDFENGRQTRIRIKVLELKEKELCKAIIEKKYQKEMLTTRQESEAILHQFDSKWSDKLNEVISDFIQTEKKIKEDHEQQKQALIDKYKQEKQRFKPSLQLDRLKNKLKGLMKLHLYDQASIIKKDLDELQKIQTQRWLQKVDKKKQQAWTLLLKKQDKEFDVLRCKHQNTIMHKLNERDSKQQILMKKYQIKQDQVRRNKKIKIKTDSFRTLQTKGKK